MTFKNVYRMIILFRYVVRLGKNRPGYCKVSRLVKTPAIRFVNYCWIVKFVYDKGDAFKKATRAIQSPFLNKAAFKILDFLPTILPRSKSPDFHRAIFVSRKMLSRSETPVFVTSTTLWSHVEKIAAIALELAELGYPVTFISGRIFEKHVTQLHPNITFEPMIGLDDQLTKEERAHYLSLPTPEEQEFYLFNKVFVDSIPYQFQTYQSLFKAFQEKYGDGKPLINFHDITTTGHHVVPLGGPGISPFANVGLNIHPLTLDSDDTFPFRTFQSVGRKPHTGPDAKAIHRKAYEDVKNEPMTKALNDHWQAKLKEMGVVRKQYPDICHAFNAIPDYLLSLGVPGFEFPRSDLRPNVRYFGAFKKVGNQGHENKPHLPSWWDEVAQAKKDGKKIVAVSQGTVEINLDDLLLPTLEALQDREDILVVATSVVKEPEEVEGLVTPSNARVAKFIPYDLLLPMVCIYSASPICPTNISLTSIG